MVGTLLKFPEILLEYGEDVRTSEFDNFGVKDNGIGGGRIREPWRIWCWWPDGGLRLNVGLEVEGLNKWIVPG